MEETYESRQDNERSSLTAIYGSQFESTVKSDGFWQPIDCVLSLATKFCSDPSQLARLPHVKLHIKCSKNYPDSVPSIHIISSKCLSNENCQKLKQQLLELAKSLVGEVMIFELAQHAEKFICEFCTPGYESCYEEMITRRRNQQQLDQARKLVNELKKEEEIRNEIFTKQQEVKKALRRRKHSSEQSGDKSLSPCHEFEEDEIFEIRKEPKQEIIQVEDNIDWGLSLDDNSPYPISKTGQSRFENEFQYIKWLGRGAFGDVIKVQNRLDGGYYAVKRIPLNAANKQLNRRITREVQLLSRLNHENVVRYYNSWIESVPVCDNNETKRLSSSPNKRKSLASTILTMLPRNELSLDWNGSKMMDNISDNSPGDDEDDDDSWISFEEDPNDDGDEALSSGDAVDCSSPATASLMFMFIQMELCEKNTLRTLIDGGLHTDMQRVWQLFREIIEGLSHIHQQGIIHRDLKPVNIFISHGDRVKIGDFGLATTIILHKQTAPRDFGSNLEGSNDTDGPDSAVSNCGDLSHTGPVGTALYIAPELDAHETRVSYSEKVDIYSLGIIFFEMCHPPWSTKMEQYKVLSELRQNEPIFPISFIYNYDSSQQCLIRWMLQFNTKERPTSHELLASKYIPPPQLEESAVKDMVQLTLSNSQTKDYKYLIASCFNQVNPAVVNATFDMNAGRSSKFMLLFETVSNKLRKLFLRHGAISIAPPLLTPESEKAGTSVRLMTRWGGIVTTPDDLRTPFARYLARNTQITNIKRYVIEKVYRERRGLGLHPKESYECAFDIVTPSPGDLMPECELIFLIWEILNTFPSLFSRSYVIKVSHSAILSAILKHSLVSQDEKESCIQDIFKVKNEFDARTDAGTILQYTDYPDNIKSFLLNVLSIEGNIEDVKSKIIPLFRNDFAVRSCLIAFNQIQALMKYCCDLGIKCNFLVSMGVVQNAQHYSGIMFQVLVDQKNKSAVGQQVIMCGGRYDILIQSCRRFLRTSYVPTQCVTGFTLSLDKFISCLHNDRRPAAFDVLVCSTGKSKVTSDKLFIIRDLWKCGIRTTFTDSSNNLDELQKYCEEFNIPHLVILKDTDTNRIARVRSKNKEKFHERKIAMNELVDYLIKSIKSSPQEQIDLPKAEIKSYHSVENAHITLICLEKLSLSTKRRYEQQIMNSLTNTIEKISGNTRVEIAGLSLESEVLKQLAYCAESRFSDEDLTALLKKYPRHKKYITKVVDHVAGLRSSYSSLVLILFSITENIFRVIV